MLKKYLSNASRTSPTNSAIRQQYDKKIFGYLPKDLGVSPAKNGAVQSILEC